MIDRLAAAAGIAPSYTDYFGNERVVSKDTKRAILHAMGYDVRDDRDAAAILREIAAQPVREAPTRRRAYVPAALERSDNWGFAVQLYSLRSRRNWGIGDFGDLAQFAHIATDVGAQAIALNPLHQLHLTDPSRASPYSPLSRLHLNALYINVPDACSKLGVPFVAPSRQKLRDCRDAEFIDYDGVASTKISALRSLHESLRLHASDSDKAAFDRFRQDGGAPLRFMAIYEALNAQYGTGWTRWHAAFRNPDSDAVAAYARANADAVEFYEFLQWLADMQLAAAAHCASQMSIGLYRDLAIGVDAHSADVWLDRDVYCLGISAGAPPDALNKAGQNWGLPPLNPRVLRERAYEPLRAVLRANMRHAGALRIDHVMGLMRLFVIPDGAAPSEGAYISYPFDEMANVVAVESELNRCMVVGEDLGTLPPGFRDRMAERRFFSCRLLYFERGENGAFCDPATYPHDAVASTGTHDLSPLAGYWRDLPDNERENLRALLGDAAADGSDLTRAEATYRILARTSAALLLLQMEDALLQREPVNVPGTTNEAPNWRRKLPVSIEMLQDDERFARIVAVLQDFRSRARSA